MCIFINTIIAVFKARRADLASSKILTRGSRQRKLAALGEIYDRKV